MTLWSMNALIRHNLHCTGYCGSTALSTWTAQDQDTRLLFGRVSCTSASEGFSIQWCRARHTCSPECSIWKSRSPGLHLPGTPGAGSRARIGLASCSGCMPPSVASNLGTCNPASPPASCKKATCHPFHFQSDVSGSPTTLPAVL